jgi:shikimate kinase
MVMGKAMKLESHLVLAGPMGAGKTTLGRLLAKRLGVSFIDSDEQLAGLYGMTAREIAELDGVEALHAAEVEALARALAADPPAVIAAAAATADAPAAIAAVTESESMFVLLEGPTDVLMDRLSTPTDHRRAISAAELEELSADRKKALLSLDPLLVVDTSRLDPEQATDLILQAVTMRAEAPPTGRGSNHGR